jgi:ribonuclease HII
VRVTPDFSHESALIQAGKRLVAGVDEVGRGPLAGPVVVAAVILDPDDLPDGLADSKALKPALRHALSETILLKARAIGLASLPASDIDRLNIRAATLAAMRLALVNLPLTPDHALIDGRDVPPGLPCTATAIVKGDATCLSIAAASIIAKTIRDNMMTRLGTAYPAYGFADHAGYGTAKHRDALRRTGASPFHRFSFAPLKS